MSRPLKHDLAGKRFGRLLVIERAGFAHRNIAWRCCCDCGTEHTVTTSCLIYGDTRSCGCLRRQLLEKRRKAA